MKFFELTVTPWVYITAVTPRRNPNVVYRIRREVESDRVCREDVESAV